MYTDDTHGGYIGGGAVEDHKAQVENIKRRLSRIEGQLKGIQRMIDNDACCVDILVQISAVRAAISKVGVLIMESHVKKCLHQAIREENSEETLDELMTIISNFIK